MSRPLRIEYPGAYYHVMNRGLASQTVFTDRVDRQSFLALLGECHEMWGIGVLAYCLLGNHYHLLIQTPEANLSRVMRHLDGVYTQRTNRRHKRDGPLFRGRYRAIVVDAEEYLLAVARYIHRNPVQAGLVRDPEGYRWSSCRLYLGGNEGRPKWLQAGQLLGRFSGRDKRKAFQAFMRAEVEESVRQFYAKKRGIPVLGSLGFREWIKGRIRKSRVDPREIPEAKPYLRVDLEECLKVVSRVYGVEEKELMRSRRGQRNEARAMAMYLCRKMGRMKQEEIANVFGVGGYSAVSSVIGRMQAELGGRGEGAQRYEQIRGALKR